MVEQDKNRLICGRAFLLYNINRVGASKVLHTPENNLHRAVNILCCS